MSAENHVQMRLTGHQAPFSLTPAAHEELVRYLAGAREGLAGDPDGDESVRDLEASVGDKLASFCGSAVSEGQMRSTLRQFGSVVGGPGGPGTNGADVSAPKWCRVLDGKWLAGVCLGVSATTEASIVWVRIMCVAVTLLAGALLSAFSVYVTLVFLGLVVLVYLTLTLLLPPVESVAEYRQLHARRYSVGQ